MKCVKRGQINHVVNPNRKTFTVCGYLIGYPRSWAPNREPGTCRTCLKKLTAEGS